MKKRSRPIKIYSWVAGSRYSKNVDVTIVGAAIKKLITANDQKLKAEEVVNAAENPLSPLHSLFEWDDTLAATEYRISQAQHLLRSVQVTISTPKHGEVTTRLTVTHDRPRQPGKFYYSTAEYALSDPSLRAEVLKQALRELIAFQRHYAELVELTSVSSSGFLVMPMPSRRACCKARDSS